jgi:chromosome segregation ATPase
VKTSDLEAEIDRLYGLPLDEFTKERNELARRLKKEGEGSGAATVQTLSKPPLAAWVANQVARRERDATRALLEAAEAQEHALARSDGEALRRAMADQREAVRALASAARGVLEEAGRSAAASTIERVSSTLAAAAANRETRAALERGRLQSEIEPSGFTALTGLELGDRRRRRYSRAGEDELAERRRQKAEAAERVRRLRSDLNDLRREAREADRIATKLERDASGARKKAEEIRAEVERLERELDEAQAGRSKTMR